MDILWQDLYPCWLALRLFVFIVYPQLHSNFAHVIFQNTFYLFCCLLYSSGLAYLQCDKQAFCQHKMLCIWPIHFTGIFDRYISLGWKNLEENKEVSSHVRNKEAVLVSAVSDTHMNVCTVEPLPVRKDLWAHDGHSRFPTGTDILNAVCASKRQFSS